MNQGLACVPIHRRYVGIKTIRNRRSSSTPRASAGFFLRDFAFEAGKEDDAKRVSNLRFREVCRSDNIRENDEQVEKKNYLCL